MFTCSHVFYLIFYFFYFFLIIDKANFLRAQWEWILDIWF